MNYEELKMVWDSQNQEPVWALNQQALLKSVEHKGAEVARDLNVFERSIILTAFSAALILPVDAWRAGGGLYQYLVALACLGAGIYIWLGRRRRQKDEIDFDLSISGVIAKALAQIEHHEKHLKTSLWGFHLPVAIMAGVALTVYSNTYTPWIWIGVLFVCVLALWGTWRDIRGKLLPEKRNLMALQNKLTES